MRLPRLRVTLWLLMIVVAVTAAAMGTWVLHQRAREYRKRAKQYAKMEQVELQLAELLEDSIALEIKQMKLEAITDYVTLRFRTGEIGGDDAASDQSSEQRNRQQTEALRRQKERESERRKSITECKAVADYYGTLKTKYREAAVRPWLAPRPDPPPPSLALRVDYWLARRDYRRALDDIDELLESDADLGRIHNLKARTLATCPEAAYRDGKRAVAAATRACELGEWTDPMALDTLAAAYAEAGNFGAAVRWQTEALNRQAPNSPDRVAFKARLALYHQGKPYREVPRTE